jgi:hypothetical protein
MPSPFPGMNPYLEQDDAWHDFHERFIPAIAEALDEHIGGNYIVKIDEHVFVHDVNTEQHAFLGRADTAVADTSDLGQGATSAATLIAPVQVLLPSVDVEREAFIEIRDRRNRQLVTVIELLSPANKNPGRDREQYLNKRDQLLVSTAHFVEIDLLRGGPRMPLQQLPVCDHCILVSRVERRPAADFWPVRLRERLPLVPIPLRAPDPDLPLDLQGVLHRVYDAAGYEKFIYETAPVPALTSGDNEWAREILSNRSTRNSGKS